MERFFDTLGALIVNLLFKMSLLQYMFDIISVAVVSVINLYITYLYYEDVKETKEAAIQAIAGGIRDADNNNNDTISMVI